MNETEAGFSVISLIAHASFGVQIIMFILFVASVISWKLIFEYNNKIKKVEHELNIFNRHFLGSKSNPAKSMPEIYAIKSGIENGIFRGFKKSFSYVYQNSYLMKKENVKDKKMKDLLEEENIYLQIFEETFDFEIEKTEQALKKDLSLLGTISSSSPYIGLLGTVYGILIAFWNIGAAQQATIATVAPSIAEALIATGMGLFVAIPSLIAYNRLSHRVDTLLDEYDKIKKTAKLILKKTVLSGVKNGA